MKKVEAIRAALGAAGNTALKLAEIEAATNLKNVGPNIAALVKTGEVLTTGERGDYSYRNNPAYKPKRARGIDRVLPVKRKKKAAQKPAKRAGGGMVKRKHKRKTTLRRLAERVAAAPTREQLLLGNLIASGRALAQAVRDQVDGLETNPVLRQAVEQQERACDLIEAQ